LTNKNILFITVNDSSSQPIGYVHLDIKANEIYLAKVCVTDKFEKIGLAKILFMVAILIAKKMNMTMITVEPIVESTLFISLNYGFVPNDNSKYKLEMSRVNDLPIMIEKLYRLMNKDEITKYCKRIYFPTIILQPTQYYLAYRFIGKKTNDEIVETIKQHSLHLNPGYITKYGKALDGQGTTDIYQFILSIQSIRYFT
jgi:predicted GNAT family acetyltransferase